SGLGFSIPDYRRDNQIWIVERSPKGVGQDIAQFAAFMNGAGRGHADVAGNSSWCRELAKQAAHPLRVLGDLWIDLAVGPFQVHIGDDRWSTMTWPRQVDHVDILILDEAI